MVETSLLTQALVERFLARMAKRWVPQVVGQRQSFGEVFVEPQGASDRARDRGDFECVGQPAAVIVSQLVSAEYLRLLAQPAKRGAMQDAIAISRKGAAI